jgi:glutamate-ammonia-ligase adenylyltransferase
LNLLEAVARRSAYLALLIEQPALLPRVAQMVTSSIWAAEYLTRHPILLDEMLDQRLLFAAPDYRQWQSQLANELTAQQGDAERQMDILRHFQHAQSFRLLAQDLTGQLQLEKLADHLSALADLILQATLDQCWSYLPVRHVARPRFAIIAYGKLGGKELGYASDLDLIFLFDDPDDAAPERYARLAQRLNTWISSTTAAGQLYETDLRLRPNGESGLLVSSVEAFRRYQQQEAWVWEHQALTRARFCAGDPTIGDAFERLREEVLCLARDPAALAREVVGMRQKMAEGHPNPSTLFDLKHDPGGMVDLEFIVQYLVLAHSRAHPELVRNLGNIALLLRAGELGLAPKALTQPAADYYRYLRRMQHGLRLNGARHARVPPAGQEKLRANVTELWQAVLGVERGRLAEFG